MSKLTEDTMFMILDQVSDWLEERLGHDIVFKREIDALSLAMGSRKTAVSKAQPYIPGFSPIAQFSSGEISAHELVQIWRNDVERTLRTS